MDESTEMPESETSAADATREWASDWADKFDQEWNQARLDPFVGKHVSASVTTSDGPKGFENLLIVGYSEDRVFYRAEEGAELQFAKRCSFLTEDGKQLPIFAGMDVVEVAVE